METLKSIERIAQLSPRNHGRGFVSADLSNQNFDIDPFIIMTEFRMAQPFFPPHPHAGVSVMTYMLEDSEGAFINRDSLGDNSRIGAGAVHVTQAGRGMQHEEVPEKAGVEAHGFQIWINHSAANRLAEPKSYHAHSEEITEVPLDEGGKIRVILGAYEGQKAAFDILTPANLFDVQLIENQSIQLKGNQTTFVFILKGNAIINGQFFNQNTVATFSASGDILNIEAGTEGVQFLFASAVPLREPIVYGGPFVMTTAEEMIETKRRYGRGEMGQLTPSVTF
jgi:quercetin 2,3-dioxygenase